MLRRAALVITDVSEECSAAIIKVTRIGATRRNIPEDGNLHSDRRENLKSYIALTGWALQRRRNVFPLKYELGFYIPEDVTIRSHRREYLQSYMALTGWAL
jgi:hypothetical protein